LVLCSPHTLASCLLLDLGGVGGQVVGWAHPTHMPWGATGYGCMWEGGAKARWPSEGGNTHLCKGGWGCKVFSKPKP
jgi:hypothetical protein